jgi:mono/diheme cytochrome c family protein
MRRLIKAFVSIIVIIFAACNNSQQPATEHANTAPVSAGQQLYDSKCVTCHGSSGAAGISNAANLKTSQLDSAGIVQTLTNGRNGMPSFKNSCSEQEIQQIASYVLTLRK